jgi:hypothetical protein
LERIKRIFQESPPYVLIIVLSGILFLGLKPRDYDFLNHVTWIRDQAGIHLRKYGIAYTNSIIEKKADFADGFHATWFCALSHSGSISRQV